MIKNKQFLLFSQSPRYDSSIKAMNIKKLKWQKLKWKLILKILKKMKI